MNLGQMTQKIQELYDSRENYTLPQIVVYGPAENIDPKIDYVKDEKWGVTFFEVYGQLGKLTAMVDQFHYAWIEDYGSIYRNDKRLHIDIVVRNGKLTI